MAQGNPRGKPASWIAAAVIIIGFIVGGVGLITGPEWWLFWTGVGITAAGALYGAATGIMQDVH